MKKIGIGRTAEAFELDDGKLLKLFYENMPESEVKKEYDINTELCSKITNTPKVFEIYKQDNRNGIIFQKNKRN